MPRDRREDGPANAPPQGDAKPPVLRRATLRALSAACLALIIFGTLGPLGTNAGTWLAPNPGWHWIPPLQPSDLNDIVTNLFVYLPVGVAFRLLVRRRGRAGWPDLVLGFGLSVALSYVTEVLQQFMPARSSSLIDLRVNATGALAGCLLAPVAQSALRCIHAVVFALLRCRPWTVLAGVTIFVTAVLMTVPWDWTYTKIEVQLARRLDLADLIRFITFGVVGFALTAARVRNVPHAATLMRWVLSRVTLLAIALEATQIFLISHACGILDILIGTVGGLAGCGGALLLVRAGLIRGQNPARWRHGPPTLNGAWRNLILAALVLAVICVAGVKLWSADPPAVHPLRPDIRWVPFQAHFLESFKNAVADIVESVVAYAFITVLCLLLTQGRRRLVAILLLIGLVAGVEAYDALFGSGLADVTPLLLAVATWLLTSRLWDAVYPPQIAYTRSL